MPCDSIRRNVVNFDAADLDILVAAVTACGHLDAAILDERGVATLRFRDRDTGEPCRYADKRLNVPATMDVDEIKRAYSQKTLQVAAKRFGWQMKSVAENKFVARRSF
jgi:hypothetical protein